MSPHTFTPFSVAAPPPVVVAPAAGIEPPPGPPGDGEVAVWSGSAGALHDRHEELAALLDEGERARCARLVREVDRLRFARFHGAVRVLLAGCLQVDPASLRFARAPGGKPVLAAPHESAGLSFNLSHTGDHLLLACGRGMEVGVDIEERDPRTDVAGLAARFFHAREEAALAGLPESAQRVQFFRWWTAREAWLKARGQGLDDALAELDFSSWAESPWLGLEDAAGARWLAWSFGSDAPWAGTLVAGPAPRLVSWRPWGLAQSPAPSPRRPD